VRDPVVADESEELTRYRDIINQVGDGFFVLGADMRLIEVNAALCRMFGRSEREMIGRSPLELVTEDSRPLLRQMMERIASTEQRRSHYHGVRADGSTFPLLVRAITRRNRHGKAEGSAGFITDLSEIVEAQQAIASSEREL